MADIKTPYATEFEYKNKQKLQVLLDKLPVDCVEYFKDIKLSSEVRTQIAYAFDLLSFYGYLSTLPQFNKPIIDFTLVDLNSLVKSDILDYLNYMADHPKPMGNESSSVKDSCNTSLARYLSSIKGYFKYLYMEGKLDKNVTELVRLPKLPEKEIIALEPNEIAILLDCIEHCADTMPENSQKRRYQEKTSQRDLALISLFLGTGMRISELVGIDLQHVDLEEQCVYIYRKGGKAAHLYYNKEVSNALLNYINDSRTTLLSKSSSKDENALFLSMQGTRMTVRAIEKMLDKYKTLAGIKKHLTPHKLRATYGTELWQQTGDILLVSTVLGHKSTDTAKKHYTKVKESNFRRAAQEIKLRDN